MRSPPRNLGGAAGGRRDAAAGIRSAAGARRSDARAGGNRLCSRSGAASGAGRLAPLSRVQADKHACQRPAGCQKGACTAAGPPPRPCSPLLLQAGAPGEPLATRRALRGCRMPQAQLQQAARALGAQHGSLCSCLRSRVSASRRAPICVMVVQQLHQTDMGAPGAGWRGFAVVLPFARSVLALAPLPACWGPVLLLLLHPQGVSPAAVPSA